MRCMLACLLAHSSSYHHIEYIGHNYDIHRCSWPITFGYDIIEASMARPIAPLLLTAKLCHRMCPDEMYACLTTARHITISSILVTITTCTDAHGPLHSG